MWWLVWLFVISAAVCFVAAGRGSRLQNPDATVGLRWLLLTAGIWNALQAGVLLAETEPVAVALYTLELLVGFATVGPWLYFASAYAGRDYHHRKWYRVSAVGIYLLVVTLKLTNSIHGRYFSATLQMDPVRRLVIDHGVLYWWSFILAYLLTGAGFVVLYRLYRNSEHSSRTLVALFAVTGVAIVPNTIARLTPALIPPLNYEPIGVALFALGTLYLVEDTFLAVEETAKRSFVQQTAGGILVCDADSTVREFNERAAELFPAVGDRGVGTPLAVTVPKIAAAVDEGRQSLVDVTDDGGTAQTYCVTTKPLTVGNEAFGRALLVQDVTATERRRERLERHEAQLGDMAGAIAHELRNSVAITAGYLESANTSLTTSDVAGAQDAIGVASGRLERMEQVVEDLHTLVRCTREAGEPQWLDFRTTVREAADTISDDLTVTIENDGDIAADPTRLKQLWKNAIRFAVYNDATTVTVRLTDDGFAVSDDGKYTAAERTGLLFEYESAEPNAKAGMSLPNVRAIARVEGWTVEPDPTYTDGLSYRIGGVQVEQDDGDDLDVQ